MSERPRLSFETFFAQCEKQRWNMEEDVPWASLRPELVTAEGKGGVNTPAGRKGAEIYLELLKYAPPNVRSYTFPDVNKAIQTGQAAMAIQWASGAKPMEDPTRSTVAGKLGYTLVPKAVRQTPMRGVWTIGIPKNSPNQDAAWEFAKWFSSKEFGLAATKFPSASSAIHSPRISVLQDPGPRPPCRTSTRSSQASASPRSARGSASSPTSRSTSGSPPASSRPASSPSTPP